MKINGREGGERDGGEDRKRKEDIQKILCYLKIIASHYSGLVSRFRSVGEFYNLSKVFYKKLRMK